MTLNEKYDLAVLARSRSYSIYSKFAVGAVCILESGEFALGCNIENASYGLCNCAERSAFFSAVSNGDREFSKIAIVGSSDGICYPCGICRQVIVELAPNIEVICAKDENIYEVHTIQELLPHAFTPADTDCTKDTKKLIKAKK